MRLSAGDTIADRYRVHRAVGFGGAGDVYRVEDARLGKRLALKLLYADQVGVGTIRQRFLDEARLLAAMDHPHLVPVYDVGEHDGRVFFVMEYADRGNAAELFRQRGRAPRLAVDVGLQVLDGLAHAHDAGCVHRDIKPANILVFGEDRFKLGDFGVALHEHGPRHTQTGEHLGTLGYMAPEQRLDPRDVGPAADLYAVGASLYTLLLGQQRPPPALHAQPIQPEHLPGVPDAVRAVVHRATRPQPSQRYASAAAMRDALADAHASGWP